jgi:hypothetical protein
MAFGFRREAGTGRGYVNVDNPLFAPGQRLSRRQYDKYVEQIGARTHLPGAAAIRDAERRLEALREALAERSEALDARERELAERELALAEREREGVQTGAYRRERQGAGQRRYNLALDLYVRAQREAGRTIDKRQARSEPAFKAALADIKGQRNPKNNPNIRDRNLFLRKRGFRALGGADQFKEEYEARYGNVRRPAARRANRSGMRTARGH